MASSKNKIVPHLWFDKEAKEAIAFYTSVFPGSELISATEIGGTPSGNVDILTFKLKGQDFMAINAGPFFRINQSISFSVYCGSEKEIHRLYEKLAEGGSVLMPLDKYDWSPKYAWVQDKFGVSWQLDIQDIDSPLKIVPTILFVNEKSARLKEAVYFYKSIFPESEIIMEAPYDKSVNMPEGSLLFARVSLSGFLFNSMSSSIHHDFDFNEAISFMVYCNNQEEIDYFWDKLTEGGEEQPCGWLKDKFGLSWQIVPYEMNMIMNNAQTGQRARVMEEMFKMKKLDLNVLKNAYNFERQE